MTKEQNDLNAVQQLQQVVVNALEDVKAVDIKIFETTKLTPLFDRVIIASGQSSRQTKALAKNVYDQVVKFGLANPRMEGEENAEWIIIDCASVVVHLMQPAIRDYYRLEELWEDISLPD